MLVRDFMTPHPITVDEHTRVAKARALLREHGVRRVLVTRGVGELVGMLTDRELREALTWLPLIARGSPAEVQRALDDTEVGVLMDPEPKTIVPDAPIEEAMSALRVHRVTSLVVLEGDRIVGILTRTDCLRMCETTLMAEGDTDRHVLDLEDPGRLWRHLQRLEEAGTPAVQVVTYRERLSGRLRALLGTQRPEPPRN